MSAMERVEPMTIVDFSRLYEEQPFELIYGEKFALSPNVAGPNRIAKRIFRGLAPFEDQGVGEVFMEAPFVLADTSDWVKGSRVPDVMFFRAERLALYRASTPDWQDKPYVLVPDLVVEVVSPTDNYSAVNLKIEAYLADGVRLVWVLDPQRKRTSVYAGERHVTLGAGDILDGGDVIPGLRLKLDELFG